MCGDASPANRPSQKNVGLRVGGQGSVAEFSGVLQAQRCPGAVRPSGKRSGSPPLGRAAEAPRGGAREAPGPTTRAILSHAPLGPRRRPLLRVCERAVRRELPNLQVCEFNGLRGV